MVGIIVTGHGNFASGISSAVSFVAGDQNNYMVVEFGENDTYDELKEKLFNAAAKLKECHEILIFTDLIGGSPFKAAVEISVADEKNIRVVSGTNLGMLLECVMQKDSVETVDELVKRAIDTGKNQVVSFEFPE